MVELLSILIFVLDPVVDLLFGSRHDPPRTDTRILGDIHPSQDS